MEAPDIVDALKKRQGEKSLTVFAKEIGVSLVYLWDVVHGNRNPTGKILDYLGVEKVITYRRKKSA